MQAEKQVIFDNGTDTFYPTLKKKYTGYVNSTYLDIYNHLIEEYGELPDEEIQENDTLIKWEITGKTRFEEFMQQIEDCVKNVASQIRTLHSRRYQ